MNTETPVEEGLFFIVLVKVNCVEEKQRTKQNTPPEVFLRGFFRRVNFND